MADLQISVGINAKGTKQGADEAKSAIKGVGDEAEKTGQKAKNAADRDIGGLNKQLMSVGKIAGIATAALAAAAAVIGTITAAAIKLADVTFRLAKGFADYATEIRRANQMTGLSISLLSALKAQSDLTGRSFDEIGTGIKNFTKLIGDANNGKKEAIERMGRLGIDAKKAAGDLEGAFAQAIKIVLALPPGVKQATAAIDAFGEEGVKLLPFLKEFGGDLDALKAKARELGIMLSEEDVRAAAEFNRAFAEVQAMLRGIGLTFGRELMPVVRDVFRDLGRFIQDNKAAINDWAVSSGQFIRGLVQDLKDLVDFVNNNATAIRVVAAIVTSGQSEVARAAINQQRGFLGDITDKGRALTVDPRVQNEPPTRIPGVNYDIPYFSGDPAGPRSGGRRAAAKTEKDLNAEDAKRIKQIIKDLSLQIDYFGQTSEEAGVKQRLMQQGVLLVNKELADQAIALGATLDKLKAVAKAKEEQKRIDDAFIKSAQDALLAQERGGPATRIGLQGTLQELDQQIALGRELTDVERITIANRQELLLLEKALDELEYSDPEVKKLVIQGIIEEAAKQQGLTLEIQKQIQAKRDLIAAEQAYQSLISGLDSEILDLTIQMQEYTTGIQMTRVAILELSEAYKRLTPEQQAAARQRAAEADALRESMKAQQEARRAYDDMYNTIRGHLDVLANEGFGAFFKNIYRQFKSFLLDMAAEWLTSQFFKLFFKGGNQAQAQQSGSGNGGIFGAIQNAIFGGGISGTGPGGTPVFNPGAGGSGGGNPLDGINIGTGGFNPRTGTYSNASGFGGQGRQLFQGGLSTGIGTIGTLGVIAGGAIGGRIGNLVSSVAGGALAGLTLGAKIGAIGGPWGAAIGAAAGFAISALSGLFSDPKRKRDKKEKMPALNQGFTDALKELRQLLVDVRTLRVSPDAAISRAQELRNQIASGFGLQFESKKYRKQAQTLIAQRTREADTLLEELRAAAEVARAAGERQRRIIPEFARGGYISKDFRAMVENYRRVNGMLPGQYRGHDTINARLSPGEMVLNPMQQYQVRANAGFDPFRNAGIPGYAGGGMVVQPAAQPAQSEPLELTFVFEHSIDSAGMVRTAIKSSTDVEREIKLKIEDMTANDRLRQKRRGA